uniref:Golgi associated kinase 1A n=1 Tax=Amphilophus citrinellus TaxID=61819 RepID=A0A3Q0R821_AMPCI
MTITLPLPLPPADIAWRSSRALSSTGEFRSRRRIVAPLPVSGFQQPPTHIYSRGLRSSTRKETSKHSVPLKPFGDAAGDDKNGIKERHHADIRRNKQKSKGIASKRKELAGASQPASHHHPHPDFTVNNTQPKHRIKPSNRSSVAKQAAHTYIHLEKRESKGGHFHASADAIVSERGAADRRAAKSGVRRTNRNADRQIHGSRTSAKLATHHQALEKHKQPKKRSLKSDDVGKKQQAVKKPPGYFKKRHNLFEDPSDAKEIPGLLDHRKPLSKPEIAVRKDDSGSCESFREQDFLDSDRRRIRADLHHLPWLSKDDIQKMEFLAEGEVVSKARMPGHGQVLQVHGAGHGHPATHSERCQQGYCSLIKRTDDWFEVFAFHLDRVLGLNRSLPAILRTFRSDMLPNRYISGTPRPAVWWDPDIQHLSDEDNDQNSVPLSWVHYQKLLKARCGSETDLRSAPCVGVQHSEWGRLALFDFLLQVNDRLDRYCCGFIPDPTELCVENLLYAKCANTKDLLLVHILVRKADPSTLVFIDNAGRPQQSTTNLNFRLVEGINEFPEKAVSVLRSGCLENLLLRSLYTDREFWDSHGGSSGLRPLIRMVEQRGKILLQHIRNKKLQLKRDL